MDNLPIEIGDCFLFDNDEGGRHMHIVIEEDRENPYGQVILVYITSSERIFDPTTIFEPGIHEFCRAHGFSVTAFSAEELKKVPGEFSGSAFVEDITGVDNVCERSAVLGAGDGRLVMKKTAWEGATMAVAFKNISLDWKWRNN